MSIHWGSPEKRELIDKASIGIEEHNHAPPPGKTHIHATPCSVESREAWAHVITIPSLSLKSRKPCAVALSERQKVKSLYSSTDESLRASSLPTQEKHERQRKKSHIGRNV